jgi:hypothetical protein
MYVSLSPYSLQEVLKGGTECFPATMCFLFGEDLPSAPSEHRVLATKLFIDKHLLLQQHLLLKQSMPPYPKPNMLTTAIHEMTREQLFDLQKTFSPVYTKAGDSCPLCDLLLQKRGAIDPNDGFGYCIQCLEPYHTGCALDVMNAEEQRKCPKCHLSAT